MFSVRKVNDVVCALGRLEINAEMKQNHSPFWASYKKPPQTVSTNVCKESKDLFTALFQLPVHSFSLLLLFLIWCGQQEQGRWGVELHLCVGQRVFGGGGGVSADLSSLDDTNCKLVGKLEPQVV